MKFLALLYSTEGQDDVDFETLVAQHHGFQEAARSAGVLADSNALQPTSFTQTVRVRDKVPTLSGSPNSDSKEQLGGYYLLDCNDAKGAVDWANKIPTARYGTVELRPIAVFD